MTRTTLALAASVLVLTPIAARAQTAATSPATVTAPAKPTDLELARMETAKVFSQFVEQSRLTHQAEDERDQAKLALVMAQYAPVRKDFEYDWSTGSFRDPKTGKVWDFDKKALVDDAKTPKPAAKPKGGGQ